MTKKSNDSEKTWKPKPSDDRRNEIIKREVNWNDKPPKGNPPPPPDDE